MKLYRLTVVAMMLTFASCSKSGGELKSELIGEWEMVSTRKSPCHIRLDDDGSYIVSNVMVYSCCHYADFGDELPTPPPDKDEGKLYSGSGKWDVHRDLWKSFDDIIIFNGSIDGWKDGIWDFGVEGSVVKSDGEWVIQFVKDPDSWEFQEFRKVTKGNNKRQLRRKGKKRRKD